MAKQVANINLTSWCRRAALAGAPVLLIIVLLIMPPAIAIAQPAPAPTGPVAGPPDGRIPPATPRSNGPPPPVIVTPPTSSPVTPRPAPVAPASVAPPSDPSLVPSAVPSPDAGAPGNGAAAPRPTLRTPPRTDAVRARPGAAPAAAPLAPADGLPLPPAGAAPNLPSVDEGAGAAPPPGAAADAGADAGAGADPESDATAGDGVASASDGGWVSWLPYGAGALALLLAGWWLGRRRGRHEQRSDDDWAVTTPDAPAAAPEPPVRQPSSVAPAPAPRTPEPAAADAALAAVPPVPAVPAAAAKPSRVQPERIAIALTPVAASSTLVNLRLRYAVTLTNISKAAITGGRLRLALLTGRQVQEAVIRQWYDAEDAHATLDIPAIAAGASADITGEIALPLSAVQHLGLKDRMLVVPIIAAVARYTHARGVGHAARSFVIGIEGTGDKLAPLPMDRGPASFAPLAARDIGIADHG